LGSFGVGVGIVVDWRQREADLRGIRVGGVGRGEVVLLLLLLLMLLG
jgi:hypothetical protein